MHLICFILFFFLKRRPVVLQTRAGAAQRLRLSWRRKPSPQWGWLCWTVVGWMCTRTRSGRTTRCRTLCCASRLGRLVRSASVWRSQPNRPRSHSFKQGSQPRCRCQTGAQRCQRMLNEHRWEPRAMRPQCRSADVSTGAKVAVAALEMTESHTQPPPLLGEADLIALMDRHGIGTDATMHDHIQKVCRAACHSIPVTDGTLSAFFQHPRCRRGTT